MTSADNAVKHVIHLGDNATSVFHADFSVKQSCDRFVTFRTATVFIYLLFSSFDSA